ncbi:MAG: hypothetical protein O3A15_02895 [Proteobacteria bacterium]|nr:hypothetical protein [Pseudomonadota bacterium]
MINDLRRILCKSSTELLTDALGVGAITIILAVGLYLPNFV